MLTTHTRHAKEKMSCRSIPKHHLKMQITVIFHTASWQGRVCLHVQQCTHNPHPQHCWVPKHHKIPHSSIPHCPGTWHLTGLCPHPPTTPFLARAIPLGSFLPASSKFILTLQVHLDSPPISCHMLFSPFIHDSPDHHILSSPQPWGQHRCKQQVLHTWLINEGINDNLLLGSMAYIPHISKS